MALFKLLRYLFLGSSLFVVAWAVSFFDYGWSLAVVDAALVVLYLGLRWLHAVTRPHALASRDDTGKELALHQARYGAGVVFTDVTPALAARLQRGSLEIYAGNQLAGDPCPGTAKELVVDYSYGGERRSRTVKEGDVLSIP